MLFKTIDKSVDDSSPLLMAKVVGKDTIENLAREIAKLHKPIEFNWHAKFGLPVQPTQAASATPPVRPTAVASAAPAQSIKSAPIIQAPEPADEPKAKQKLICNSCGDPVPYNVAKFCWFNKPKFGGNIYCMECQKKV